MPPGTLRNRVSFQHNFTRPTYDASMLYRNQSGYSWPPAPPKRRQRRPSFRLKFHMALVGILILGVTGHSLWAKHVSAQAIANEQAKTVAAAAAKQKQADFRSQISTLISTNPHEDISVTIATANSTQTFGETAAFDGASTAKLLTAVDYLHHVEQGTTSLTENISGQSAQHWLKIMLIDSDDTAWSVLNTYLTHSDLADYANSIGFKEYNYADNTFTSADVTRLLQQLYSGKLLDNTHRSLLLGYLKQANYRQYIVAAVPAGDTVYHKIGLDDDTVNDAAIISNGKQYLVLTIFTNGNGSYDWDARQQLIQAITKDATAAYL